MTNLVEINFLEVTYNLINWLYQPYKKPDDELQYINVLPNHPPQILKQLTTTISERLSRNLSSVLIFNESKYLYEVHEAKVVLKMNQQHLLTKK